MTQEIIDKIKQADMVLVGIGEEFDGQELGEDQETEAFLAQKPWMRPALRRLQHTEADERVREGLTMLAEALADKNYFVITTSTNDAVQQIPWKEGRLTAPCGGSRQKQCPAGCAEGLALVDDADWTRICAAAQAKSAADEMLGVCPNCGKPLILNNIYTEFYDEKGYLQQWALYTKWLQGTLNQKLLLLELGVNMACPSVIRFPFERTAYYNRKAELVRVNRTLYQLTAEVSGRGQAVKESAIEWLFL